MLLPYCHGIGCGSAGMVPAYGPVPCYYARKRARRKAIVTYEELSAEEIFALPPREVLQAAALGVIANLSAAAGGTGGAGGAGGAGGPFGGGRGGPGGAGGEGGDAGAQQVAQVQAAPAQAVD